MQNIAKDIAKLNPYHHNENDAKVAIKDIYNLDPDVATNLSLWYAGVLNNLVKKYDLKNVDGMLLRDVMHLAVTNYSLETANYINNQVNKNTDEFLMGKSGAYNIESVLIDPQAQKNNEWPMTVVGSTPNYDVRPEFLKAIDGASTPWGGTEAVNPKKITNLDEFKEAIWNNVILYNLLDSSFDEDNIDYSGNTIKDIKQFEHSALNGNQNGASIFGPALFMQGVSLSEQNLNGKLSKDDVSQYSFALAVDKAGQITPHWYHVTKDYQNNENNQPIQLSTPTKPHADSSDVNTLQEQYNQAKADLNTLEAKLAKLQKAAADVTKAQKDADDAHAKLAAAKQKLQEEQAKLATLKAALDKAIQNLNAAKAKATDTNGASDHQSPINDQTTTDENNQQVPSDQITDGSAENDGSNETNNQPKTDNTSHDTATMNQSTSNVAETNAQVGEARGILNVKSTAKSTGKVTKLATSHNAAVQTDLTSAKNATAPKQLPQTGNSDSAVVGLLGVALAIFGLGVSAKKRRF